MCMPSTVAVVALVLGRGRACAGVAVLGAAAPDFTVVDTSGKRASLAGHRGKPVTAASTAPGGCCVKGWRPCAPDSA